MASAKDLRKRITSVKNTQQITKAMKMVSAAKLRRAQNNITALRPYAKELKGMIEKLSSALGDELSNQLLNKNLKNDKLLLILVTSDKGLCGAFNGSIAKAAIRILKENTYDYKQTDLAFIGKKGFELFKSKKSGKYYQDFFVKINFKKCKELSDELIEIYKTGQYDGIKFIYNEFKSAISQNVVVESFLPVAEIKSEGSNLVSIGSTIYEPNANQIIDELLPKHFATQIYRIILDSIASEFAARMTAMENATKNAGEMLKKLSLEYNKSRQASITKELLEIVSGSEALK